MNLRTLAATVLACLFFSQTAVTQSLSPASWSAQVQLNEAPASTEFGKAPNDTRPNYVAMVAGGFAGAGLGLVAGVAAGVYLDSGGPEFRGAVVGSMVGTALLTPLGVHIGNGRRGNYGLAALVSLAVTTAIFPLAGNNKSEVIGYGVPLQLVTSILIERATGRQ